MWGESGETDSSSRLRSHIRTLMRPNRAPSTFSSSGATCGNKGMEVPHTATNIEMTDYKFSHSVMDSGSALLADCKRAASSI